MEKYSQFQEDISKPATAPPPYSSQTADNVQRNAYPNLPQDNNMDTAPPPVQYVVQQTQNMLGPHPTMAVCPSCHQRQQTTITHTAGTKTHLIAVILFMTTLCCCCIPYCVDSCQNVEHRCGHCGAYLGVYNN